MILPMVKWKKTMKVENMQKTFFIIKPDAVKRHLIGQVLDRIERRGFIIGIMSGPGVIKSWRDMMGATNPGDATPGTIRGDFATAPDGDMVPNIVHGSDSEESAAREIQIWFGE